ncbi:MAG: HEPN domain-containing protein [Candidatus Caldarchaeum sp.]|nr:HEPN domain-containing protein [Candidatus Caldarchaeum sp.]
MLESEQTFHAAVPHIDEIKLLQKRAKSFLKRAEESLNSGDYDTAVFLAEQAAQLHLKSVLLSEVGDYPRTRSISYLHQLLRKIPAQAELTRFLDSSKDEIRLLEDAYIASRYLMREYSDEEAQSSITFAKKVLLYGALP